MKQSDVVFETMTKAEQLNALMEVLAFEVEPSGQHHEHMIPLFFTALGLSREVNKLAIQAAEGDCNER